MNPLPASGGPPPLEWDRWEMLLRQYATASGLVVSLFDGRGVRRIGPILPTRLAKRLGSTRLWEESGPGSALEQTLVQRVLASGLIESEGFCTELHIRAMPLRLAGEVRGVLVFGWVLCGFPTAMANDHIARELGLPAAALWRDMRLEAPVSPARFTVLTELLQTLVDSNVQQMEAIEELQALSEMRDMFLARVSHDLRTPLTAISLRIETLLHGTLEDPSEIRSTLASMQVSVAEEARLIDDLIDAARTRTGQLRIDRQPTQLVPILTDAYDAIRPQADKKGVRLQMQGIDTDQPTPVYADGSRLRQVFWNLLSNAVKFTPAEGTVAMQLRLGGGTYEISVRDSGDGIEEDMLLKIFDTFIKRERANDQGLGLGLPIAKHIVELHGGSVRAFSDGEGHGTTMVVVLPVAL